MPRVIDDILPILTKFHREVVLPDIQRIVTGAVGDSERRLRDEIHTALDALAQRLDSRRAESGSSAPQGAHRGP